MNQDYKILILETSFIVLQLAYIRYGGLFETKDLFRIYIIVVVQETI